MELNFVVQLQRTNKMSIFISEKCEENGKRKGKNEEK